MRLLWRSPNLKANLERWHRSVRGQCLSRLILFGEASLKHVHSNCIADFHGERNHRGKGNVILFPRVGDRVGELSRRSQTRERLDGRAVNGLPPRDRMSYSTLPRPNVGLRTCRSLPGMLIPAPPGSPTAENAKSPGVLWRGFPSMRRLRSVSKLPANGAGMAGPRVRRKE